MPKDGNFIGGVKVALPWVGVASAGSARISTFGHNITQPLDPPRSSGRTSPVPGTGRGNLAYSVDSKRDTITLKTSSGMAAWWKIRSNGFMTEAFTTSTTWPSMFHRRVHGVSLPYEDMCGAKDRMSKKWKIE